jgi:inner membrane protein
VDSLTHALIAAIAVTVLAPPELIPFAVLGSVIIDADVLFSRISDRDPALYLFSHGGIAHSIVGSAVMSVLASAGIAIGSIVGSIAPATLMTAAPVAVLAVLGGSFLHIALDWLACPGIPLLAPFSDRKYTAGLLPGPSILLFGVSLAFLAGLTLGIARWPFTILPYGAIVVSFLAVRFAAFVFVRVMLRGALRLVPMVSPLRWLVIRETPGAWDVAEYRVGRGMTRTTSYPVGPATNEGPLARLLDRPEVRRVRYHSYIVSVEMVGSTLVVSDPLRSAGIIRYPPHYRCVRVSVPE